MKKRLIQLRMKLRNIKKEIISIFIFLLTLNVVLAVDENISINSTETYVATLNVTLQENANLFITRIDNESKLIIDSSFFLFYD